MNYIDVIGGGRMGILNRFRRSKEPDIIDTRYNQVLNKLKIIENRLKLLEKRVSYLEKRLNDLFKI